MYIYIKTLVTPAVLGEGINQGGLYIFILRNMKNLGYWQ